MSHPVNRLDRFQRGVTKSKKRVSRFFVSSKNDNVKLLERWSRSHRDTTKKCSCRSCGNPRKFFKEPGMQERKFGKGPIYTDQ